MNTTPRKYYDIVLDGPSTPSGKNITPMAKLIVWIDEQFEKSTNPAEYSILTYARNVATSLLPEERKMVEMAWDDAYATGCVVGANDYTNEQDEDTGFNYFTNNYKQLPAMTHAVKPKCPKCGSDKINDGTGTGWEVCECGYMA